MASIELVIDEKAWNQELDSLKMILAKRLPLLLARDKISKQLTMRGIVDLALLRMQFEFYYKT